MMRAMSTLDWS